MRSTEQLNKEYSAKPSQYYESSRYDLLTYIPADVKIALDIGCGSGNFGRMLKEERNCIAWGIEPSESAAREAAPKLDKVINGEFSRDLPELQGKLFDAIFFNDVLEHLVNPEVALKETADFLRKDGYIIASIPNILFYPVMSKVLMEQDWKYEKSGTLDNTHLRFFTKKSIVRLFQECSFDVLTIEGINQFVTKRYALVNFCLLNHLKEWRYEQFVVVARVKK